MGCSTDPKKVNPFTRFADKTWDMCISCISVLVVNTTAILRNESKGFFKKFSILIKSWTSSQIKLLLLFLLSQSTLTDRFDTKPGEGLAQD